MRRFAVDLKLLWRSLRQGSTYLGLAMIALLWLGLHLHLASERANVQNQAIQNASNLTRAFEEHLVGTLKDVDRTLQLVRSAYERDLTGFDLTQWSKEQLALEGPAFQIVIIDRSGFLKATTEGPQVAPLDLSDREHFRVHVDSTEDNLFISKPLIGRVTNKAALQLSRRVRNVDGSFGGVILISLDPGYFARFYDSISIGSEGVIRVVGTDGVVRAVGRSDGAETDYPGKNLAGSTLLARAGSKPSGWYFTNSTRSDRVRRLEFYRIVPGFPLIVTVGLGTREIFLEIDAKERAYYAIAAVASLIILISMGVIIHNRIRLEQASETLLTQNMRFDAALNNITLGLCMFDANHRIVVCNNAYFRMFGLAAEQVRPGTTLKQLIQYKIANGCAGHLTSEEYAHERLHNASKIERLPDGRALLALSRPMASGGWVTTYENITERLRSESRVARMARHDALTGLGNRFLFLERLEQAVTQARNSQDGFTVLMLDLDSFKGINDTLGHSAGDELLRVVANRLVSCTPGEATIARLGGDEFAILRQAGSNHRSDAMELAAKIINALSQPCDVDGHEVVIGASIGIAMAPEHGSVVEHILRNADLALYQSKLSGRSGYRIFSAEMEERVRARSAIERDLRRALERDEFEIYYQTIVDLATHDTFGVEALIRWRREGGQLVCPSEFIPIAEDIGLIVSIGKWVLDRACKDAMKWPSHVRVAVNLSPAQFGRGDLVETVAGALRESGLAPQRLELEITESVLLQSSESNLKVLAAFKAMGVGVVLDDFGTGYSSLTYLSMFAFDKIKIDRSFVAELINRAECAAIVSAIINLGRSLNMTTVAEGVETERQRTMLRAAGCFEAQGYLFSRPVPADELDFVTVRAGPLVG